MIVMNDRSAGGSGYNNGTIEIMINRRTNGSGDGLGNEEIVFESFEVLENETNVV